ncbi:DUF3168 domain-containing protein [Burkholderia sp. 22PA0099]|uniref:DUF3168 domain-containing protein n=1 Tax=Burkholderia sp. 22PA0099 TaxID=3237372 RepID=UPI0039C0C538
MATPEAIVYRALESLADGRVYPDQAPDNIGRPYIVYQSVGGEDGATLDGAADTQNSRMQVAVWSTTRSEAVGLIGQVRDLLTAEPISATPIGSAVSTYDTDTKLRGSRQDFSIWYR